MIDADLKAELDRIHAAIATNAEETGKQFRSVGDQLVSIEDKLDKLTKLDELERRLEQIRENIREKLHVEV